MLKVAIGHSNDPDSRSAIDDVIAQCQATLAGVTPKAGILYAAVDFDHAEILHQIDRVFPNLELIGCTTDGEVSSVLAFQQDSIVLTLFCTDDDIEIRAGVGRNLSQDPVRAAGQAVQDGYHWAKLCIALPESLTISAAATLNALKAALGQTFPIFGGFAADQWRFKQTYQFYKTEVLSDALPILLFSGSSLKFSYGACTGFQPVSQRMGRVTKADRNVVYEIDGKSALEFYSDYFGALDPSPEHPLAVFDQHDRFFLRGFSSFDRTVGSITAFADLFEGDLLTIATASREDIIAAAKQPILEALQAYPGVEPAAALFFPCGANRQLLGTRIEEEFQLMQASLGHQIPCSGFYTFGELAPLEQQQETQLLQHTVVTLLLGTC